MGQDLLNIQYQFGIDTLIFLVNCLFFYFIIGFQYDDLSQKKWSRNLKCSDVDLHVLEGVDALLVDHEVLCLHVEGPLGQEPARSKCIITWFRIRIRIRSSKIYCSVQVLLSFLYIIWTPSLASILFELCLHSVFQYEYF